MDAPRPGPERVSALLESVVAPGVGWQSPVRVYDGALSTVFRVEAASHRPVAVKLYYQRGTGIPAPDVARTQFDSYQRVATALGESPTFRVPAMVSLCEEHGLVVQEWAPGTALNTLLGQRAQGHVAASRAVHRAGGWLRHFHRCQRRDSAPMDVRRRLEIVYEELDVGAPALRDTRLVRRTLSALEATADSVASAPLEVSWLHGDFKPQDLVISEETVYGIDIGVLYENVTLYDAAQFLNHLDLLCHHPVALWLLRRRAELHECFLDAAIGDEPAQFSAPLHWIRAQALLRQWVAWGYKPNRPGVTLINRLRYGKLIDSEVRALMCALA